MTTCAVEKPPAPSWESRLVQLSNRQLWMASFATCLPIFLVTAHYGKVSIDTQSAYMPAWQLAHHGNVWLEHMRHPPHWTQLTDQHLVSNRMAGAVLIAVPVYIALPFLGPNAIGAAIAAALMTAATVATMVLVFRRLANERVALVSGVVLALGTSLWTICSAEVWPHTLDAFALALLMFALARSKHVWAGLALGLGILARPHLALVGLVVGLYLAWKARSPRPALSMGVGSVPGVVALILWNDAVFGRPSLLGGYAGHAPSLSRGVGTGAAVHVTLLMQARAFTENLAGFLFSPLCGLFVYLPLALLLVYGARAGWRASPTWVRAVLLGGVAYSLMQLRVNGFSGGDAFYGYRLATELVMCAAPLAVVTYRAVALRERRRRYTHVLAVVSVGIQALGALGYDIKGPGSDVHPWVTSRILIAVADAPLTAAVVVSVVCAVLLPIVFGAPSRRHSDGQMPARTGHSSGRALTML